MSTSTYNWTVLTTDENSSEHLRKEEFRRALNVYIADYAAFQKHRTDIPPLPDGARTLLGWQSSFGAGCENGSRTIQMLRGRWRDALYRAAGSRGSRMRSAA
jgi:hypothetical protein